MNNKDGAEKTKDGAALVYPENIKNIEIIYTFRKQQTITEHMRRKQWKIIENNRMNNIASNLTHSIF